MAWFPLSSLVDRIIEGLHSEAVQQIGVTDELSELENNISIIKAIISDPKEKQEDYTFLEAWEIGSVDARDEVDRLVDDLSYEALRQQLAGMLGRDSITKKVCTFFSTSSNQAASHHELGKKIKAINEVIKSISKTLAERYRRTFYWEENIDVIIRGKEPTPSYISKEQVIIGRDRDTMAIKRYLLNATENSEEKNVEVIPIVGRRGIGKTTLAQLVFHDEDVVMHFDLRLWVNLSCPSDERVVIGKIVKSATNQDFESLETYQLQQKLGKIVRGKRYLLVLDDVLDGDPNGDPLVWTSLKNLSSGCANGSRIIITSSHWDAEIEITKIIGTTKPYELEPLDEEESWALFKKVVFKNGEEQPINSQIVKMIVERCAGSPFAIKTIGRMLQSKDPETEWSTFLETDIISRIHRGDRNSFEGLRFVWDNFPLNLKNCLAYCSLFPEDFEIDVKTLINLWIAQGFIYSSPGRYMEDLGYEYFRNLCWESVFQEVEKDENGIVRKCRMAPLMHKFVIQAAETALTTLLVELDSEIYIRQLEEHVSFGFHLDSSSDAIRLLRTVSRVRTILLPSQMRLETEGTLSESVCDKIISGQKLLRVLDLHNTGIDMLPDSIGKFKYLRYLDVSQNSAIKSLPKSITMLLHLTVLKLSSCYGLQELPRDIHKLISLRHVEIDWCYSLTHLPRGLGRLTQLQTLSEFVLSKDNRDSCSLSQLAELNNLRGKLKIKNLENDIYDSKAAILKEKEHLTSLTLAWDLDVDEDTAKNQLDRLEPPSNIKELVLVGYDGIEFSSWFSSLNNLVKFSLRNCKCRHLPLLSHLSSLKVLVLDQMASLEYISNEYENNHPSSSSSAAAAAFFPSLEELRLTELPNLEGWWGGNNSLTTASSLPSFRRLSKLMIEDCPNLRSMPLYTQLTEWLVLDNTSLETFLHTMDASGSSQVPSETKKELSAASTSSAVFALSPLSRLQSLCIIGIKRLDITYSDKIKWEGLRNLRFLRFDYLPKLNKLPEGLQHVTTLHELHIWRCNMKTLPEWIGNFKFLTVLGISVCPYLKSLPEAIKSLSSLMTLEIVDCPILLERCKRETGADWHKIKHIPERLLQ